MHTFKLIKNDSERCVACCQLRQAAKRQAVKKLTFKKISDFFVVYISNRLRYFRF
jgi:hypothetical protein